MGRFFSSILFIFIMVSTAESSDYWQQKVQYKMDVQLLDSLHQVSGHETIRYINNSPHELSKIWMHLWPNAYKNNETALAKQKIKSNSTKMHFLPDSSFGWIDISNVQVDKRDIQWRYRSDDTLDVALFTLNKPLPSGDSLTIDLDFVVRVPNVLSRLGHFGKHYEMTQWYPKPAVYDMKGWHPISYLDMGEFYSEWGDFDVHISVPKNYRVAATGVLQDSSEIAWRDSLAAFGNALLDSIKADKKSLPDTLTALLKDKPKSDTEFKTIQFKQENVHDFAWFADKRFIITNGAYTHPSGKVTQTWTYTLPKNFKNYRHSNIFISDAVKYYSKWFMEYPYQHASVVDGDFSAGGGMEYPMITLINNAGFEPLLELVIMHEVGHNWFYGLSGNNERDYPWMDEGLNSYAENRYWRTKYTDDSMLSFTDEAPGYVKFLNYLLPDPQKAATEDVQFFMSGMPHLDQAADLHSEAYSNMNYGMMVYKKSALVTDALHAYLGETLMDSIWHTYFNQWAYHHPQPEDIRRLFEDMSGEDLSWYFDDMLGSTQKVDYALNRFSTNKEGAIYETNIDIENLGDFAPPLAVGLYGDNEKSEIVWIKPSTTKSNFTLKTEFPVKNVKLDPEMVLLDMNRYNNDKELNLKIKTLQFAMNRQADYLLYLNPYLWSEQTDRLKVGFSLAHNDFIDWSADWKLKVKYGLDTKKIETSGKFSKNYFGLFSDALNVNGRFTNHWAYSMGELGGKLLWRDHMNVDNKIELSSRVSLNQVSDGILDSDATVHYFDSNIWSVGTFTKLHMGLTKEAKRALWNSKFEAHYMIGSPSQGDLFSKASASAYYRKKLTYTESIRFYAFSGMTFGSVPLQDRFYLSTDVDPDFNNAFMFSRNDGRLMAGDLLTFQNRLTIPGYLYDDSTNTLASTTAIHGFRILSDVPKVAAIDILLAGAFVKTDDDSYELKGSLSPIFTMSVFQFIYSPAIIQDGAFDIDATRFQINVDMSLNSLRFGP